MLCHSTQSICMNHAIFSHCQFYIRYPRVQSAFYIFTETLLNKHAHNLHQKSKATEPQPVLWKLSATCTVKFNLYILNVQNIKLIQIENTLKKRKLRNPSAYKQDKKFWVSRMLLHGGHTAISHHAAKPQFILPS